MSLTSACEEGRERAHDRSRAENLARAQALEGQGRLRDARDLYTKCVDITPEMALQLIKVSFPHPWLDHKLTYRPSEPRTSITS